MLLEEEEKDEQQIKKKIAELGVKVASKILGLEEIAVFYKDDSFFGDGDINSIFIKHQYYIIFRESWINTANDFEILSAAFHEVRHAYQNAQFEFPELMIYNEPKSVVEKWQSEFTNYNRSKGKNNLEEDKKYIEQLIEIDAIAFEQILLKELLNIDSTPHKYIYDKVMDRRIKLSKQYKIHTREFSKFLENL